MMREMISNPHWRIDLSRVLGHNFALTQNVRFGRFASINKIRTNSFADDAQRPAYTASFVHRYPFNSLWRNGSASAFLQKDRSTSLPATIRPIPSAQYRLSSFRSDSLSSFHHHGRLETNQQDRHPSIQWNLPFLVRTSSFPRSIDPAPFPQTTSPQVYPSIGGPTRSTASQTLWSPRTTIRSCLKEHQQIQSPAKFVNLLVNDFYQSNVCAGFRAKIIVFTHY